MTTTLVLTSTQPNVEPTAVLSTTMMAKKEAGQEVFTVVFNNCSSGLGIKIIGGVAEDPGDEDFGIFIKRILHGGLAQQQGQLQEGDQLLEVNGESLEKVTNNQAVQVLRKASAKDYVKLLVCRDDKAREDYIELLQNYSCSSASSVCDPHTFSSRGSNSSAHGHHNNSWGSPLSPSLSVTSAGALSRDEPRNHTHTGPGPELSGEPSLLKLTKPAGIPASEHHTVTTNGVTIPTQPKIPSNATAASLPYRGVLMKPGLHSTPQEHPVFSTQHSPPDGASGGGSPGSQTTTVVPTDFEPSPIGGACDLDLHSSGLPSASRGGVTSLPDMYHHSPPSRPHSSTSQHSRKLSLDPHVRLKVEKLQLALQYLGIEPTAEQQLHMRQLLSVDESGAVTYGAFVRAAREVFQVELEERNISQNSLLMAPNEVRFKDFTEPPAFTAELRGVEQFAQHEELDLIRRERDDLRREVTRLKSLLKEKEGCCYQAEEELMKVKRDAQGAIHESRSLRSKVHLAEQAQRAARHMEQDYEEVIRVLEAELADLRVAQPSPLEHPSVQRRLAVLGCQLRKAEVSKKTYEVSTEKLLQFAERVHETLVGYGDHPGTRGRDQARAPSGVAKPHATQALGMEARDVIRAVKSLMEIEPLPFGWDEAYTADGMRYYINHVTQVTTWQHPLTQVHHGGSQPPPPPPNQSSRPAGAAKRSPGATQAPGTGAAKARVRSPEPVLQEQPET